MGDSPEFQRGQIVGACLAGASVIKTATLLGVSRAEVSKVVMTYTNYGNTSAKRKRDRKPKLRDRRTSKRIVSKTSHTTTAKVTSELSTHLEDPVSTKIVRRKLHKSNIHGRAATDTLLTTENAKRRKRWCDDHKTWMSEDWKYIIWSDELFFTLFPT